MEKTGFAERIAEQVGTVQTHARRAGILAEDHELVLLAPEMLDGQTLTGWTVVERPVAGSPERRGQGPQSHPHFIVDGGMLGVDDQGAYEALRATIPVLVAAAQARREWEGAARQADTKKPVGSDREDEYRVSWEIETSAGSPEEAAREALEQVRDPASTAHVFEVTSADGTTVRIDLNYE